jgi:hypothetical protein
MPPILADDSGFIDLPVRPEVAIPLLVEEDGLEDMVFKGHVGRELGLVVCAVEAHLELGEVGVVGLNVVHGAEVVAGRINAGGLVDT